MPWILYLLQTQDVRKDHRFRGEMCVKVASLGIHIQEHSIVKHNLRDGSFKNQATIQRAEKRKVCSMLTCSVACIASSSLGSHNDIGPS